VISLDKKTIKQLLASHQTELSPKLGQNYLVDHRAVASFVATFVPSDVIIEIGPGIGTITSAYFKGYKRVILIELDQTKIPLLQDVLTQANDGVYPEWVEILHEDFLTVDTTALGLEGKTYQVVGALPYNISKRIIYAILHWYPTPLQCSFILQKEVAQKYHADIPDETFLSVSTKLFGSTKLGEIFSPGSFYPSPKVSSRILIIKDFLATTLNDIQKKEDIATFIRKGFEMPRKKLVNGQLNVQNMKVRNLRPQELEKRDWESLFDETTLRT
jgi:16S rRNA (adenine1518-N6/adenine1519-N6)-dimethyltransferase